MDLSSLINEMDDLSSFDQPKSRRTEADIKNSTSSSSGASAPTVASALRQMNKVNKSTYKKKSSNKKLVANKHKTWGECPVDLMADFLAAVSASKLSEAMKISNNILKHEPDNPLIHMYQESLSELITAKGGRKAW